MAREYARIRISIASDGDVEALSPMAQWLYFRVFIADPKLSHCGIGDWRPKRLLGKARGLTLAMVLDAAAELERTRFALFDDDTEEYLVRSYIRTEELMRNPKMAVAVGDAYLSAASRPLRAVIATEVLRDRVDHPEYSTWTHAISREAVALLASAPSSDEVPYVDVFANPIGNPETVPNSHAVAVQNGNDEPVAKPNVDPGVDWVSETGPDSLHLAPNPLQPAPISGGDVSTEGHQEPPPADPNDPPPRFCPKHMPDGTSAACLDCRKHRQAHDRWQTARTAAAATAAAEERLAQAQTTAMAIVECGRCDDDGYAGGQVCAHRDHATAETRAAARAQVAAALGKGGDA